MLGLLHLLFAACVFVDRVEFFHHSLVSLSSCDVVHNGLCHSLTDTQDSSYCCKNRNYVVSFVFLTVFDLILKPTIASQEGGNLIQYKTLCNEPGIKRFDGFIRKKVLINETDLVRAVISLRETIP